LKQNMAAWKRNVLKISSGTLFGQMISMVALILISRIYGARIMGIWTSIMAISLVISSISDLGLSQAIMMAEDDGEVERLFAAVPVISLVISFLGSVPMFFYYHFIDQASASDALFWTGLLLAYSFTYRQVQTNYVWLNRKKDYNTLMLNPIVNNIAIAFTSILFGYLGFIQWGYYIGMVVGQIFTLLHMRKKIGKVKYTCKPSALIAMIRRYPQYVKFQMPALLMVQLRQQIPSILIGSLFGKTMLGYYSISYRLINFPVNMLGQALGTVFYQATSELIRSGKSIVDFVLRSIAKSIRIAIIPGILFFAYGDGLIVALFGTQYYIGGVISRIVVFQAFFMLIFLSIKGLSVVLNKQQYLLISCVIQTVLTIVSILIGYYVFNNIYISVVLYTFTFIIVQAAYLGALYKAMGCGRAQLLKPLLLCLLIVLLLGFLLREGTLFFLQMANFPFAQMLLGFFIPKTA
jgi:O-antigen/teichoic acid export membrane protein